MVKVAEKHCRDICRSIRDLQGAGYNVEALRMQSLILLLSLHHLQGAEATQRSLAIVGELSHFAFLNHPFSWARGYLSTSAWIGPKHSATCRTVHAQALLGRCKKRAAAGHQSSMHQCDFLTLHSECRSWYTQYSRHSYAQKLFSL